MATVRRLTDWWIICNGDAAPKKIRGAADKHVANRQPIDTR
jgi:hypothetical protein